MRNATIASALLAGALLVSAADAGAQVFTPSYQSPVLLNDLGVYVSDTPGEMTLEGIWRAGPAGLRVGFVDGRTGDLLSIGGEVRMPLTAPIPIAFTAGAQALVGEFDAVGVQAGVTLGQRFVNPGVALTPYIHPRIAASDAFGVDGDFETELLADLGVDAEFAGNLILRLNVGLSDESPDVGLGLAWRR